MSGVWRDKNDVKVWSPSCLATVVLFLVALCVFAYCLSAFLTEKSGKLFAAVYPLMEPMVEEEAGPEERAAFSNAYFRIAGKIDEDPMIITNKSLLMLRDIVMDQRISREEIARLGELSQKLTQEK